MSEELLDRSFIAGAAIASTWLVGHLNTAGQFEISTTDGEGWIIAQEIRSTVGRTLRGRTQGVSKIRMNTTIAINGTVHVNTTGQGEGSPAAGIKCLGVALEAAAAAGDVIEIEIRPVRQHA